MARLIRDVDDGMPEVRDVLKALYPHTGKAYIIGITGAPGVGKSTLVDQMVAHLRKTGKDRRGSGGRSHQSFQRGGDSGG